jgi:hypothetical protein
MNMKNIQPVCYNPFPSFFPSENLPSSQISGADNGKYAVCADNQGYKPKGDTVFLILPDHKLPEKISNLAVYGQKLLEKLSVFGGHDFEFSKKLNDFIRVGFAICEFWTGMKFQKSKNSIKNNNNINY